MLTTVQAEFGTHHGKISLTAMISDGDPPALEKAARSLLNLARKTLGAPTLEEEVAARAICGLSPEAAKRREGSLEVIRARLATGEPCLRKGVYQ